MLAALPGSYTWIERTGTSDRPFGTSTRAVSAAELEVVRALVMALDSAMAWELGSAMGLALEMDSGLVMVLG